MSFEDGPAGSRPCSREPPAASSHLRSSSPSPFQVIPPAPQGLPLACLRATPRPSLAAGHRRMLPFMLPRGTVTTALPGGGTVTWGWRGPPRAAPPATAPPAAPRPSILRRRAFGVLARGSPCAQEAEGAVPVLGGHVLGTAAGRPCQFICTFRLCKEGHLYHTRAFGSGGAGGERQGFGSLCMNFAES